MEKSRLSMNSGLIVGICLTLSGLILASGSAPRFTGPTNITRKAGEDDVIIACPAYGPAAPIWQINSLTYGASSLPYPFQSAFENLLIPIVEASIENYSFQCFIPTGIKLDVVGSSIGVLNVDESGGIQSSVDHFQLFSGGLKINHQKLRFSAENLTISWLYSDDGSTPDCLSVLFRVQGWACTTSNDQPQVDPIWSHNITSGMDITIDSSDMMDKNVTVFVTLEAIKKSDATTVCSDLKFGLQVKQPISTNINIASVGENVCIDVPALGVLFAVWPNSPANRSLGDCECPLCNQGDCRLELCHCINDSIYTITLQSDHSKYKLCFHDITVEMNGTFVHFYYDRIKCDEFPTAQGTFLPVPGIYRLYIASNWIIIKEPPKPPVLKIDGNRICFSAESLPVFPVLRYEISIYDVTGERAAFRTVAAKYNCTSFECRTFEETKCAPFEVSVRAFNRNGPSNSTVQQIGDEKDSDICGCLNTTVKVNAHTVDVDKDPKSVKFKVFCNYTLEPEYGLRLIVAVHGGNYEEKQAINCTDQKSERVVFQCLEKKHTYISFITWVSESAKTNCSLITPFNFTTAELPHDIWLIIYTVPPGSLLLALFFFNFVAITVWIVYCYRRKEKDGSYSTVKVDDDHTRTQSRSEIEDTSSKIVNNES